MATIDLKINAEALDALDRNVRYLGGYVTKTRSQLLKTVGESARDAVKRHIRADKKDSKGRYWPALSAAYTASKRASRGSKLFRTRKLHNSVRYTKRGYEVSIGANAKYANAQNLGYEPRNLPAREFLYLTKRDVATLGEIVAEFMSHA